MKRHTSSWSFRLAILVIFSMSILACWTTVYAADPPTFVTFGFGPGSQIPSGTVDVIVNVNAERTRWTYTVINNGLTFVYAPFYLMGINDISLNFSGGKYLTVELPPHWVGSVSPCPDPSYCGSVSVEPGTVVFPGPVSGNTAGIFPGGSGSFTITTCPTTIAPASITVDSVRGLELVGTTYVDACCFSGTGLVAQATIAGPATVSCTGDLSVTKVQIAQTVFDPDINNDRKIDLVSGKETVILATIAATGYSPADRRSVTVNATLCGNEVARVTPFLGAITPQGTEVKLYFIPYTTGNCDLVVTVNPDNTIPESVKSNNSKSVPVTVKDTQGLYVAYLRVDCLGSSPSLTSYADTVSKAGDYLFALFPVAPSKFVNQALDTSINCTGDRAEDALKLLVLGWLLTSGAATRFVGIADPIYFQLLGPPYSLSKGFAPCGGSYAFVRDGYWDTVSHEIGHTYELNHPDDPPDAPRCNHTPGTPTNGVNGYWVERLEPISGKRSLMASGSHTPIFPSTERWITRGDYEWVFANNTTIPSDPEVLLVSGILHKNGQIELKPFYRSLNGIVSTPDPGDFSVDVLDTTRHVLYSQSFDIQFALMTHPPTDTDTMPFVLAVPYPQSAAIVQVQRSGQVLAEVSVTTKLLHDAVASIPDTGFTQNPTQRRNALFNKIAALDQQLATGALTGARNKLQNDIRNSLLDWLVNGYLTQSPLEYTKDQILDLVDELLQRLGS